MCSRSGTIATMWLTFWLDVLVATIGALLTVAIAFVTYILNLRQNERRALSSLVNDLHRRRVFSAQEVTTPGARESADFMRCNASILSVKDEIRHARNSVREIPVLQESLAAMTKACNVYLEMAERDPDSYSIGLVRLRENLHVRIKGLARSRRGVPELEPGRGAFD